MNHQQEAERLIELHYAIGFTLNSEAVFHSLITVNEIIAILADTPYYKQERYNDYIKVKQILEKY